MAYEDLLGSATLGRALDVAAAAATMAAFYLAGSILEKSIAKMRIEAPPDLMRNLARTAKIALLAIGLLVALSLLGVNVAGLLVAAGFAGMVIGLALQQTLGQLFAGLSLMFEGRVRVGDTVRIDNDWGVVESVGLMSTKIRLFSGEVLTVPNNTMMASKIYNYSRLAARRIELSVGISYGSDVSKALEVIRRTLDEKELVLAEPAPLLIVNSLGESSVNINVLFWVPAREFLTVRREILAEIKRRLEEAGIEIPFPQRVVWLRSVGEAAEALGEGPRSSPRA
ncbi:MAG: mechanosensitive ion channel family protein [Fervidicoccaceae archaeon]